MSIQKLTVPALMVANLLWAAISPATAQEFHPALHDTHTFYLGAYFQDPDGRVASRSVERGGGGIDIDTLGAEDSYTSLLFAYDWRFGERWSLSAGAHVFRSDGSVTLSDSFEYNGEEFEAGFRLDSDFSVDTYLIDVMYSLVRTERSELAIGGGVHAFDFQVEFTGTVFIDEESLSGTRSSDDLLAPLPNLRVNGRYALTPRWLVRGALGWLSANVDSWEGEYTYVRLGTDYRFGDHFGVGLGYQYYDVDVSNEGTRTKTTFDLTYQGPTLYLIYGF